MTPTFPFLSNLYDASKHPSARDSGKKRWILLFAALLFGFFGAHPSVSQGKEKLSCLAKITAKEALLVVGPDGEVLYRKHETKKRIPASTLKILTSLAALDCLGPSYRFRTEVYTDTFQNLKLKGYGDPLLISEVLNELADILSGEIQQFQSLILDDTYFSSRIKIPGCGGSTNPYDAPVGAICANFNTVVFRRDRKGRILSSERQTPMIPFARKRIRSLGLKRGRYTFLHDSRDAARYAGELLLHFLKTKGVTCRSTVRLGEVEPGDRLIYTYRSIFPLETVVQKMLKSSSNFIANQLLIALGAATYGPPGTLAKGVDAITRFSKSQLGLEGIQVVEGSGISRQNRISAVEMLTILKRFKPYRHLLKQKDNVLYKTGSLKGIRTKVGYVEDDFGDSYYFIIFLNQNNSKMAATMSCVKRAIVRER
ncbi:MAG: D-alanyl-D-alanine carboxypeptidase [Deltaproteobacteria bacterium]|nr:D-alanyl-D-alanine carboxypeptidase [Deltaproteobacteria bacterium]